VNVAVLVYQDAPTKPPATTTTRQHAMMENVSFLMLARNVAVLVYQDAPTKPPATTTTRQHAMTVHVQLVMLAGMIRPVTTMKHACLDAVMENVSILMLAVNVAVLVYQDAPTKPPATTTTRQHAMMDYATTPMKVLTVLVMC
jgi:hypothetical protein